MTDRKELEKWLSDLRAEHRNLDAEIATLTEAPPYDHLDVQRLKRKKLGLKDRIARIEGDLYPDIIA